MQQVSAPQRADTSRLRRTYLNNCPYRIRFLPSHKILLCMSDRFRCRRDQFDSKSVCRIQPYKLCMSRNSSSETRIGRQHFLRTYHCTPSPHPRTSDAPPVDCR
jgi:hypothetical protein